MKLYRYKLIDYFAKNIEVEISTLEVKETNKDDIVKNILKLIK